MSTVSPTDYFLAGRHLLAEGGIKAVTIANLCERLGVTKGSFYHHFRNGEDFLERLLDDWLTEHVERRTAVVDALGDPMERLGALRRLTVDREHETESAIRAWARSNPRAAAVQKQIDETRISYLIDTYTSLGVPPERALTLAQLSVVIVAGTQNLVGTVDREMYSRLNDEVYGLILDAIPETPRRRRRSGASSTRVSSPDGGRS